MQHTGFNNKVRAADKVVTYWKGKRTKMSMIPDLEINPAENVCSCRCAESGSESGSLSTQISQSNLTA